MNHMFRKLRVFLQLLRIHSQADQLTGHDSFGNMRPPAAHQIQHPHLRAKDLPVKAGNCGNRPIINMIDQAGFFVKPGIMGFIPPDKSIRSQKIRGFAIVAGLHARPFSDSLKHFLTFAAAVKRLVKNIMHHSGYLNFAAGQGMIQIHSHFIRVRTHAPDRLHVLGKDIIKIAQHTLWIKPAVSGFCHLLIELPPLQVMPVLRIIIGYAVSRRKSNSYPVSGCSAHEFLV